MKVLNISVDWHVGWANNPTIKLLVDKIPHHDELRYSREGGIWYAELDGYVSFYSWQGPGNEGGFGGREFKIKTTSGRGITLKGPWSSRAGDVNREGFGPCLDVSMTDKMDAWERGYTFNAASATKKVVQEALKKHLPEVVLLKVEDHGDIRYDPVFKGMTVQQSKEHAENVLKVPNPFKRK